ncbi:MAG: phosphotransferase family protein [Halieaceae bacterium]|jgi:aminoglycoside phosphotransferase (APT) family kinase protein|nr:phosphotransferase family protein [Halieaceae bacterium]
MKSGEAFNATLQDWLNQHWRGTENLRVEGDSLSPAGSGFSATTLIIPVSYTRDGWNTRDHVVVRMESDGPPTYPQQSDHFDIEIELQYRAMEVLSGNPGIPVAPLIGYEADASILGAPFFAMGYIEGDVPIEQPIYTATGFYAEAAPVQRTAMIKSGLEVLANIHDIDWQGAGVDWLLQATPGIQRQLEIWREFTSRELAGRKHPVIEATYDWLLGNTPSGESLCLNWGDARLGNMIWQDFSCACVCDFENIAVASPSMDVGWWLMFDRYAHEAQGVERLPGELTRDEQVAYYERCTGTTVQDRVFYELFAGARYAAMVVRVMNRWVANGDLPADQTLWLQNPVADMLANMLEEFT